MRLLNKVEKDVERVKELARTYTDLKLDKEELQKYLNSIEAVQKEVGGRVRRSRRRY